jgi:hypothetical protein
MNDNIKKLVKDFEKRRKPGRVIDYEAILKKAQTDLALQKANEGTVQKRELMKL